MKGGIKRLVGWSGWGSGVFEARTLAALLVAVGCGWGFLELADEVREGATSDFDRAVLVALRQPGDPSTPIGPEALQRVVRDITALGSAAVLTLLTLLVAGWLGIRRKWNLVALLLVSVGGATLLSMTMKVFFDRERPDLAFRLMSTSDLSFPSGHSTLSAATFLTIGLLLSASSASRREKVYYMGWAVFLTVLVGLSRLYLGVHFPTDVLAGWCIGTAWALACSLVARYAGFRATLGCGRAG
jgi:undecaprenyl-diphosphatase